MSENRVTVREIYENGVLKERWTWWGPQVPPILGVVEQPAPVQAPVSGGLDAAMDAYELDLARLSGKPANARKQATRLRTLARERGWTDLRSIGTVEVTAAMNELAGKGRKVNTIETLLGQLSELFEWATAQGWATTNPCDLVKRSKRKNRGSSRRRGMRPLTDAEVARLIAAAEHDEASAKPRCLKVRSTLYLVARLTGARLGQLHRTKDYRRLPGGGREEMSYGLRWRDVDLERGTITFDAEDSKNGDGKSLPLHDAAAAALRRWRERCEVAGPDDFVWPWKLQDRVLDGDLKAAGIPKKGSCGRSAAFHSLRKSFAYGLVRSGVDVNVARRLLQHRTLEMTLLVYDEVRQEDLAAGLGKMFTPGNVPSSNDLWQLREGRIENLSLTSAGRTDSVSHLDPATPESRDPATPPGSGAHAPGQGHDAPLWPGDAVGSLVEQLGAALTRPRGAFEPPLTPVSASPANAEGRTRTAAHPPEGRFVRDVAGVLEAVARLLRTGAARDHEHP